MVGGFEREHFSREIQGSSTGGTKASAESAV